MIFRSGTDLDLLSLLVLLLLLFLFFFLFLLGQRLPKSIRLRGFKSNRWVCSWTIMFKDPSSGDRSLNVIIGRPRHKFVALDDTPVLVSTAWQRLHRLWLSALAWRRRTTRTESTSTSYHHLHTVQHSVDV